MKGKNIPTKKSHDGSEGHWLEKQMGIQPNCQNRPDIGGYEMKKESNKITFGDFSASEYLFSTNKTAIETFNGWEKDKVIVSRNDFIHYFGSTNSKKQYRYSWSGSCVPIYGEWNESGQILEFNNDNDLCIYYSYCKDRRTSKDSLPAFLKNNEKILIVIWTKEKLGSHVDNKFSNMGFFICKKIGDTYEKICFGKPFDFIFFVENMKKKNIIFDSGMYVGNTRNYSSFRSSLNFWNLLITEEY